MTIAPLIPVGLGLGLLFVRASRAALNASASSAYGRVSTVLSVGRLLGAAAGAGLADIALSNGLTTSAVHHALLLAGALCLILGLPAATRLRPLTSPTLSERDPE